MSMAVLMYFPTRLPRTMSCLLAAAIALQPVTGFSCGCDQGNGNANLRSGAQRRCGCCNGSGQSCGCCGASHASASPKKPQRSCCHKEVKPAAPQVGVCHCSSRAPAPTQPAPTGRIVLDDQISSPLYGNTVTADLPVIERESWAVNPLTAFVSAAEHCIALCKLLF
jgi:hypothetical protein